MASLHPTANIFPEGKPGYGGYDFILINPRTLDYVGVNVITTASYEFGETHSSFTYMVRCGNQVGLFPSQHQCPEVPNAACAAATCDVLGCKVDSRTL